MTRCANGDLFIADTGNHRIRRIDASTGIISTVLGLGIEASSGQGFPATDFPVDEPLGLACDAFGNLFATSTNTVRLLPASDLHIVDGSGPVQTIYNQGARLTGIAIVDEQTLWTTDADTGRLIELQRQAQ